MNSVIRPANAHDRDAIVDVFLACWKTSYAGVLPQTLIDGMDRTQATALWSRVLAEPKHGVLVGVDADSGEVLGVTRWAPGDGTVGFVHSLYVSPAAQGRRLGARLLGAAAEELVLAGCTEGKLWVFRDNAPSIGFYRSQGWSPDGETRVQPEFGEPELRLSRPLTPAAQPPDSTMPTAKERP